MKRVMLALKKSNMYPLSKKQLNLQVGCEHGCIYCESSFQLQLKRWAKGQCLKCYMFQPHRHLERMDRPLPRTKYMQFIFLCSNGDIAFATRNTLLKIMDFTEAHPERTFLLQSKDPVTFNRVKFPDNVILGTTIESNRERWIVTDGKGKRLSELWRYSKISKAPHPLQRIKDFEKVNHSLKMLTYEPVLDFDLLPMITFANRINPCMIWLGMDSKPQFNKLPEPSLAKVKELHWELVKRGFVVILKTIRPAWWEKQIGS